MSMQKTLVTAQDLLEMAADDRSLELVEGELIEMVPAGSQHGRVANNAAFFLTAHVKSSGSGQVFAAETGFLLSRSPDTVRAPDAAFVAKDRLPEKLKPGFLELAPDLVVEVVSPGDGAEYVQKKVATWLEAGTRLVWVVYPEAELVMVHRNTREAAMARRGDILDGQPVFDDFTLPVDQVFD